MIDVAEGRRLKAAANEALEMGERFSVMEGLKAVDAWDRWLDVNIDALLDAAERAEAAERERDEARIELRRMQAGELPGGWTEELQIAINARHKAERERDEARKDAERFIWWFGDADKRDFATTYLTGVREGWALDQWRAAIDAARAKAEKGKG